MRKQPEVSPPEVITAKQPDNVITQVREYQLITPLYGGGVKPAEADPITVVRATEIRGHLRFWWRACRGGKFNGNLAAMKREEDAIWGKAYKKGDSTISQEHVIQITTDVDSSRRGEPVKPFIITEKKRPKSSNNIPGYAAFPLQPDRDELKKREPYVPDVQKGVSFSLTISFPEGRRKDIEAALWAWETFGGLGARTRRGFGALHLLKVDGVSYTELPFSNNVKKWINEKLIEFVELGVPPAGIPHLSRGAQLAVTSADDVMRVWKRLIDKLQSFRQAGRPGRSLWPEAEAIRAISSGKDSHDKERSYPQKFPRAALGLPIIFHFKDDSDPEDTTLKEAGEKMERFASPLILHPFLCRDNRAVGLILLLEGSRVDLENLVLEDEDKNKQPVKGTLTKSEAQKIAVLNGETDVLQAFYEKGDAIMNARLTFVHALSPLHAGTGQGAGVIDLPIAREKATGLPFLPGSSLKGTLRARCSVQECKQVFGPDTTEVQTDSNYASSAQFSDQRLLLLPIRSLAGTFAWITSPYVLRRLARDIEDAQITPPTAPVPDIQTTGACTITVNTSKIKIDTPQPKIYLEDLELNAQISEGAKTWAEWIGQRVFPNDTVWQQVLTERMCIVHDDVFNFMIDTATEISARIKLLEESKTVQEGGLWYEEALPTETILSGIVLAMPTNTSGITIAKVFEVLQGLTGKTLQFGGKATVGRGMCRVLLAG